MPEPTVSVVIPVYNAARFVTEAVDSVLAQTSPPLEIIVVDDGSTDETRARLAPYRGRIQYVLQPNSGTSRARNRALQAACGTLIAFLDADDRWLPEKLAKQLTCLAANPGVDLVHSDVLHWNDRTGTRKYIPQGRERFTGRCYREFFWHCRVLTSSVVATRRCLDEVGVFDEGISGGRAQDMDLWLRVARRFSLAFVPEPLVHYRHHDSNATRDGARTAESTYHVFRKALRDDPELWISLGREQVLERMSRFAFDAAYAYADAGDLQHARRYFRSALEYTPGALYLWALWGSAFLPLSVRERLRVMKQRSRRRAAKLRPV